MTATTVEPRELPSFTDADFRTARTVIFREIAQYEVDGELTHSEAFGRIVARTPHLDERARVDAYDQLVSALERLDHIRSDMWAGTDADRQVADLDADDDAENALRKLVGRPR